MIEYKRTETLNDVILTALGEGATIRGDVTDDMMIVIMNREVGAADVSCFDGNTSFSIKSVLQNAHGENIIITMLNKTVIFCQKVGGQWNIFTAENDKKLEKQLVNKYWIVDENFIEKMKKYFEAIQLPSKKANSFT